MPDTIPLLPKASEETDNNLRAYRSEYSTLTHTLEELLAAAQPRLERFARAQNVAPDGVDDVVQETLVEAWRHLEHLQMPERFDAWLNGICRNVCLRWVRTQGVAAQRQRPFSELQPSQDEGVVASDLLDIPDPLAQDPAEELSRQDLATLLDRAMGHLPIETRKALVMHYIADLPQREIAQRLGVTLNALEVKLHRARRQLRQVLSGELREEAQSFGLAVDKEMPEGWRETGLWCPLCGRQRLIGCFEPMLHGEINMRMRCPICTPSSLPDHIDIVNTSGIVPLANIRSFRPALKRTLQVAPAFYAKVLKTGYLTCPMCQTPARFRGGIEQYLFPPPYGKRAGLVLHCLQCGGLVTNTISACSTNYAAAKQFMAQHPRCVLGVEEIVEYQGQEAIRTCLIDIVSASRFTMFLHHQTLHPLAAFLE
jgi:RNA polymerase sigma-70 factor (ECF subfamily)